MTRAGQQEGELDLWLVSDTTVYLDVGGQPRRKAADHAEKRVAGAGQEGGELGLWLVSTTTVYLDVGSQPRRKAADHAEKGVAGAGQEGWELSNKPARGVQHFSSWRVTTRSARESVYNISSFQHILLTAGCGSGFRIRIQG